MPHVPLINIALPSFCVLALSPFLGPGALYVLERLLRIKRANQRVVILSCTIMDDVFSLEFAKEGVFSEAYKVTIQRNTEHLQHVPASQRR